MRCIGSPFGTLAQIRVAVREMMRSSALMNADARFRAWIETMARIGAECVKTSGRRHCVLMLVNASVCVWGKLCVCVCGR